MPHHSRTRGALARRVATVLTAVALLTGGLASAALADPSPSDPKAPLRVLLEGDSITHGFNGDYTWRYRLAREFTRQRVSVDFVGSKHTPYVQPGYRTAVYLDPHFDSDHFATGGSQLVQHARWIHDEATSQRPDVVVLAAGVNDLRAGHSPQEVDQALRRWVGNLRSVRPEVRIVLSPVLSVQDSTRPWLAARTRTYDALLRGTARELSTPSSPITVSDTGRGWNPATLTYAGLHPNPTGETLIAQRVAEALHSTRTTDGRLVLPQQPDVFRHVPWRRNLVPTLTRHGSRVAITWDRQAMGYAHVQLRRVGHSAHVLRGRRYGGRTVLSLAPGTYDVRLSATRKRMTSPFGPARRVHVPRVRHR